MRAGAGSEERMTDDDIKLLRERAEAAERERAGWEEESTRWVLECEKQSAQSADLFAILVQIENAIIHQGWHCLGTLITADLQFLRLYGTPPIQPLAQEFIEFPPNSGKRVEIPAHVEHEDGSFTLHLPKRYVAHLAATFAKWQKHQTEFYPSGDDWETNPDKRDNRRYAIECGNTLQDMTLLGADFVAAILRKSTPPKTKEELNVSN